MAAPGCKSYKIRPNFLPTGTKNVAYSVQLSTKGGGTTFSLFSGTLPTGITLSPGGLISGANPSVAGVFSFVVEYSKGACDKTKAYSITIRQAGCPTITLTPFTIFDSTLGVPYLQNFNASGGAPPYTFSLTGGTLPPGLTLNASTGDVSGTPTTAGSYGFSIVATDNNGCFGAQAYIINVNCPTITLSPSTLPAGTTGQGYSQTIFATGGTGPYTFAVTAGALPTGLSLNTSTGAITGTTTVPGTFSFTITATDADSCTGTQDYAVDVNNALCPTLSLAPPTFPDAIFGVAYSQNASASGGQEPYTYAITGTGTLPSGLSMDSGGAITGTPDTIGIAPFTITATDANGCKDSAAYAINVVCPEITFDPATLPSGNVSTPYTTTVTPSGGTSPYQFDILGGNLPDGTVLDPDLGTISGTPTAIGSFSFLFEATDANVCSNSKLYNIDINAALCPAIIPTPIVAPNGQIGVAYSQGFGATGGATPYGFVITGGTPVPGLALDPVTGVLSGTPTTAGSFTFDITVTDLNGCAGTQAYTVNVTCLSITLNPANLPSGIIGTVYSQTITPIGGNAPYSFTSGPGALPNGLSLNGATGAISGTPTTNGVFPFQITATDAGGCAGNALYAIAVNPGTCPGITLSPSTLPDATLGSAYSQAVTPTGGAGPFTYGVSGGTLPAGITLDTSTGLLSGTPTATGSYSFAISATDTNGCHAGISYTLKVVCPTITFTSTSIPSGTVNTAYNQSVAATGGDSPYTYAVTAGKLPDGLSLDPSTGAVSGIPTKTGSFAFLVTATDVDGCTGSQLFLLDINPAACPTITVDSTTLPDSAVGTAYSQQRTASGGTGTYTYTLSGSVPPGLSINSTGLISGTPTATGTYTFSISAKDTNGCSGSQIYTVTMTCPAITVAPSTLSPITVYTAYNQQLTPSAGTAPFIFLVTVGSLPPGVTLSTSGLLSGSPTASGSYDFTVSVTDSSGCSTTQAYELDVTCIFCDDFNDGNLTTPLWTTKGGSWTAITGDAVATVTRKGDLFSPAFTCTTCTFESHMKVDSGGIISMYGWYVSGKNNVELRMYQNNQKLFFKQKINGSSRKKTIAFTVLANHIYDVALKFDGANFTVSIDGTPVPGLTFAKLANPSGKVSFRVKSTTGAAIHGTIADFAAF